jgi:uncharacterized protein
LIPLIGCRRAKAIIAILGLAALGPDDAQASGIDCARATASIERKICTDPALSSADAALSRSFEAALALSLDPAGLRAEEVDWLTHSRDKAATNDELAQSYTRRQGELDKALGQLRRDKLSTDTRHCPDGRLHRNRLWRAWRSRRPCFRLRELRIRQGRGAVGLSARRHL